MTDVEGQAQGRKLLTAVERIIASTDSLIELSQEHLRRAREQQLEGDEAIGAQIVRRAIESPIRMLCANAGVEGAVVAAQDLNGKGSYGYNVATGDYEDLVKAGVVDPTTVTRMALQNAASIAGLLLTIECMITEIPEPAAPAAAHAPGAGMDY